MAKSVLEITQNILSKMDSDEINSISDTLEGQQIAEIVTSSYEQIVTEYDIPAQNVEFQLFDAAVPQNVTMKFPENIQRIDCVRYDIREEVEGLPNYQVIPYQDPEEYLKTQLNLQKEGNVEEIVLPSNTKVRVRNDVAPTKWTTFDQKTIFFNSYDSSVDSNLQPSKTSCTGSQYETLVISDNTVIDLPRELYIFLEFQALELAFDLYGGGAPKKVRDLSRKARIRCQRNRDKLRQDSSTGPNYGRHSGQHKSAVDGITTGTYEPLPDYIK